MHYDKVQCTEQTLKHVINYGIAQDSKHTLTQQIKDHDKVQCTK